MRNVRPVLRQSGPDRIRTCNYHGLHAGSRVWKTLVGVEPTSDCFAGSRRTIWLQRRCALPVRVSPPQSGRPELNRRFVLPKHADYHFPTPCGQYEQADREALESSSSGFQPDANPSQLPVRDGTRGHKRKEARRRGDAGLLIPIRSFGSLRLIWIAHLRRERRNAAGPRRKR